MSPDDATPDVPQADAGETKISEVPVETPQADAGETKISEVPVEAAESAEATEEPAEAPAPKRTRARKPKVAAEEAVEEPADEAVEEPVDEAVEEPAAEAPAEDAKPARRRRVRTSKEPAEAPKPAPTRSRPAARRAVVRAQAKYVRTSARKARMVCGHIRGKSVDEARAILAFTPRDVARDWSKLLESAVANAENNHELVGDDLIVHEVYADEGPTIKRFRPRGKGRATPIRKRTSHLTITLTPRS